MLRLDLLFVPHDNNTVRMYEPSMQRYVQLTTLECHVAQLMNGERTLDDLTALARQYDPAMARTLVERLVVDFNSAVLLINSTGAPNLNDPIGADEIPWDIEANTVLDHSMLAVPKPPLAPITPLRVVRTQPQPIVAPPEPEPVEPDVAPEAAPDEGTSGEAAPEAAPAEEAAAEAAAPDEIAAQEQEAMWNQARKKPLYQRRWVHVLLVLGVLVGVAAVVPYPLRITSDCVVVPSERARVRTELPGVISEILVAEGSTVKKGDIIARLDDRALKADRLKKLAEIQKFEAELATLKQGHRPEEIQQQYAVLAARRNEVAFAEKEALRRNQMALEGVGSRQQADESNRELETKRRAVAEADAALRLLRAGSRPEEIAAEQAVIRGAQAELAYIDERISMTVLRAPIDGSILTPRFRERINESVEAGGLVCDIAGTQKMRAEILVPERDIDVVEVGMPAVVKVESYPTHPFEGKVEFIAPAVDGDNRRVRVIVELDNKAGMLKSNMTGYGEIEAGSRSLLDLGTRRVVRWVRVRFLL